MEDGANGAPHLVLVVLGPGTPQAFVEAVIDVSLKVDLRWRPEARAQVVDGDILRFAHLDVHNRRVGFDRFIDGKTSRLNAAYDMLLPVSRGLPERARPGRDVRIPNPPAATSTL